MLRCNIGEPSGGFNRKCCGAAERLLAFPPAPISIGCVEMQGLDPRSDSMGKGHSWRMALVCGLAMVTQGCGSEPGRENGAAAPASADSGASAAAADPCALVTKEEVAAAIGEAVVEAKPDGK